MHVAILTVGDELLAGDTENTNATWLARQVTARGASVARILTLPDDRALIADRIREWHGAFDAVIVCGGLGGTHDDVTMSAVADAFDRDLVVEDTVREDVIATVRAYREANPERYDEDERDGDDIDFDVAAWAATPAGSDALLNEVGLSPGCALESVYVFPGPPEELHAMFAQVADRFGGDLVSETVYTPAPEGSLTGQLAELRDRFDVVVGSYAKRGPELNRIKVSATDEATLRSALEWLGANVELVDP